MSFENLTPDQLKALAAIRLRRREIAREASEEHRALMGIVNAAATRRSEKRHRFMLLAGGIVGVSAPLLLQSSVFTDTSLLRVGSGLLLLTIVVGAIFDAIDERRTTPVLLRGSVGLEKAGSLALAEDIRLISAGIGDTDPDLEQTEKTARQAARDADNELRKAGQQFVDGTIAETVLFFGSFVLGAILLLLAVGSTARGAG